MPRGGKRAGAGRKLGKPMMDKIAAREFVRQYITQHLPPLLDAQIANAKGLKYLVVRDRKTGKFLRVGETLARTKQSQDEEAIEVWEKDPSVQAFTDLFNRALDRPAEPVQQLDVTGTLEVTWKAAK